MTNVREDGFRYTGGVVGVLRWSAVEAAVVSGEMTVVICDLVNRVMGHFAIGAMVYLSISHFFVGLFCFNIVFLSFLCGCIMFLLCSILTEVCV